MALDTLGCFIRRARIIAAKVTCFLDFDWASCYNTRVSTSGFCFMLGNSCISRAKRRPLWPLSIVRLSSTKGKHSQLPLSVFGSDALWLIWALDTTTTIFINSQSALAVVGNLVFHAYTKHIEVHYYYLRKRFLVRRPIWHMFQHKITLLIFLQRLCLGREEFEAFCKSLGLLSLWIDRSP